MTDWDRIEAFVGYGRLDAPIVFVGMEEGLADPTALENDLSLRSQFAPVMDMELAHRGIAQGEELFSDHPRSQPTWRVMADLMLHFERRTFATDEERKLARVTYRLKRLGRADGDSLLVELLPYPSPNKQAWLYIRRYNTPVEYEQEMIPKRIDLLRKVLAEAGRRAVVCYGKGDWGHYKQLFPSDLKWTLVASKAGPLNCATWNAVPVTLTNHFVARSICTNAQLDALAKVVLR